MTQTNTAARKMSFQRRTLLKMMMAAPVAGLMPMAAFAAEWVDPGPGQVVGVQGHDEDLDGYRPKVFGPQEWKTVRVVSDRILPADDSSGSASEAGVPEFLDDWLDLQRGELVTEIRYGLAWMDMECQRFFHKSFVDCTSGQQDQILDRIAYPHKASEEDIRAVGFFNRLRNLVLGGYFTSEAGIRVLPYLGNQPQTGWRGCPTQVLAKLGLV